MPVVALVGNKGGAGKTTLCVNLAAILSAGSTTVILDADPQRSSLQWRELAERDDAVSVVDAVDDVVDALRLAQKNHEYILIDCPPSVQAAQTAKVLDLCDVALIPVQPSPLDIWATVHIEGLIEAARKKNRGLHAVLVVNQLEPRTKLSRLMRQALAEFNLPAAQTAIRRRIAYRNSILYGRSVLDLGARGSEATHELRQLIAEVIKA